MVSTTPILATELVCRCRYGNHAHLVRSIKISNLLGHSIFRDLEVVSVEIGHEGTGFVRNYNIQDDELALHFQGIGSILRR
jgi:hypothetical protein